MTPISVAFPNVVSLLKGINTTSGIYYAAINLTNTGHAPRSPVRLPCSVI